MGKDAEFVHLLQQPDSERCKNQEENANKLGELTGLMQSQKFSTAPKSGSKALLEQLKGKKRGADVDYSLQVKDDG